MANFRETPNAEKIPVEIVGSSTFGRYHKISSAYTQNMFVSDNWLINFSGYKKRIMPASPSQGRGLYHSVRGNILIAVYGSGVYRIDVNLNVTFIGNLATESGEVFMDENLNNQICIVDGLNAYITNHSLPPNLTIQTGGPLGTNLIPNYVCFHDTFFLFGNANTTNNGAQWYAFSTATNASLGATTILGTGVLAATELVVNGVDLAGTYTTPQALVTYINTGVVTGLTAILNGTAITLINTGNITVSTAGTVGMNGLTFANFSLTGGTLSQTFSALSSTAIVVTTQLALQTKPDYAIAVKSIPSQANNVLVFGTTVCEIHTNIGGIQNYRRNSTVNVDFGCLSVSTIASSDQYVVWLGVNEANSPVIMVYHGQSAMPISTDGIDYIMGTIQFPAQSTASFFRQDGHLFYQLTFFNPADNITLMYDFDAKKFYHLTDQFENFHPARQNVYFNLTTYFISLVNGSIYEMSSDFTTIDENVLPPFNPSYDLTMNFDIPRTRITESVRKADSGRFIANSFVFTMAQGDDPDVTGLSIASAYQDAIITEDNFIPPDTDIISENNIQIVAEVNTNPVVPSDVSPYLAPTDLVYRPRVDMTISKDAGTTFGSTVSRLLNPIGVRQNIITFNNLGRANDLTIKLRFWGRGTFIVGNGELQIY